MTRDELLALHDSTCAACRAILVRKNNDYCAGEANAAVDPFANFRMSEFLGVHPVVGLLMRMMDKIQRVRAFANDGKLAVSDESVEDAFDDIVNYAILGKGLMREMRIQQRVFAYATDGMERAVTSSVMPSVEHCRDSHQS